MTVPSCPEHGDLVRDLARGRLGDEQATLAELVREECADCARWWSGTFSGESFDAVGEAVEEAIALYAPPARGRYRWLAAAAAVVLALGLASTSTFWRGGRAAPSDAVDVVSTWDFENGDLSGAFPSKGDSPGGSDEVDDESAVFVSDLESGDLSTWSSHS
jgi:hypothetical protein